MRTVYPILDGEAGPAEMLRAIRFAHDAGCGGVSIFQRANLHRDTANAVLALQDPWQAALPEPVDRQAIGKSLAAIRREVDRVEQLIGP